MQLPLHLAVLPAVARVPLADPVLFLAGGPGQGALDLAGPVQGLLGRLNNRRDLVLVDVRGTGRSAPLQCAFDGPQAARRPLAESLDVDRREAAVAACRQALQATPLGDLRLYGTVLAAQDLLAVLDALGRDTVNLVAASYGTRLALELARQAPDRVRRSVLDGVAPPDLQLARSGVEDLKTALEALLADCEADTGCAAAHPALRSDLEGLLTAPARSVTVRHPVTGETERLRLEPRTVVALLRGPLYRPSTRAGLPAVLTAAAQGRWEPLLGLAASADPLSTGGFATGLHLSVVCSEDWPGGAQVATARLAAQAGTGRLAPQAGTGRLSPPSAAAIEDPYAALCRDWPRREPPPDSRTLAPARTPVWLLSGGADPATPPRHAARAAAALGPKALHSVLPAAGHGLLSLACVRDAAARFIDAPDGARALVEAEAAGERCAAALPPPGFRVAPPGPLAQPTGSGG